jgi:glycosyltransferase involved in cell wall biosynthesis
MNRLIWIVNPYDALPGEQWGYKHGTFLSSSLVDANYQVVFWNASFSHASKHQRISHFSLHRYCTDKYTINLVPTPCYSGHQSPKRILALLVFSIRFLCYAFFEKKPACIILSLPLPFGDFLISAFATIFNIKLICEFRDLWPELFASLLPSYLRNYQRLLFSPLYFFRWYAMNSASALTAVSNDYLALALNTAPSLRHKLTDVVYHTNVDLAHFQSLCSSPIPPYLHIKEAESFWAIYAGTLGYNYDIPTLLEASLRLSIFDPSITIIIAGDGPLSGFVKQFIASNTPSNIIYLGPLPLSTLCHYYKQSDLALSIYSADSTVSMPAKAYDYISAELPIVNSLNGEFRSFIDFYNVGFHYLAGDSYSLAEAILYAFTNRSDLVSKRQQLRQIAPIYDKKVQYSKVVAILNALFSSNSINL